MHYVAVVDVVSSEDIVIVRALGRTHRVPTTFDPLHRFHFSQVQRYLHAVM